MNPMSDPDYKPKWVCGTCGSSDIQSMSSAWFDPNDDYSFIEALEDCGDMDWCNDCENETILDEDTPPDDPWGNAYGDPMYWVPPTDDEYWELRGVRKDWNEADEKYYWDNRLGDNNG